MVKWNDFAKRRKLKLEDFVSSYTYEQYTQWCEYRKVEPVAKEDFGLLSPVAEPQETPIKTVNYTSKELNKKKKAALVSLAESLGVELDGSETKRTLVSKILKL